MGIKPFNVAELSAARLIDPKEVGFQDSIDIISDELHKTRKSFIKIGWYLKHINETEMYKEYGYSNIYEVAHDKFNISQPTASRFINLCEEFSVDHNSPELDEKYVEFNVSQLFEMLPMKQEDMDQVTPDMTVKQIREMKKETRTEKEPSDRDISDFYMRNLKGLSTDERKNLKDFMVDNYGKGHAGGGTSPDYECSPRGIKINNSDEITWLNFVKRINDLFPVPEEQIEDDDNIPGQTSIEKDFPEYLPDAEITETDSEPSKIEQIIDGEYRDIEAEKSENPKEYPHEDELRDEIEELTEGVREVFWGWRGQPIPREEAEAAKENAIKLSIVLRPSQPDLQLT